MSATLGNLPTPEQLLLLHAAVDEPAAARDAWEAWRRAVRFDDIDAGSLRLLPAVYRRLEPEAFDQEVVARLKGIYRLAWSRNQLRFKRAAEAIALLEEAGIETMVLKGASLSILSYGDIGIRPMDDVDVLVRHGRAAEAIDRLASAGWEAERDDPQVWRRVHHSLGFGSAGGGSIDLHWFALWQPARDDALWQEAVPLQLAGVDTLAPAAADQLLLACVHGTPWSPLPPFRWIADALTVIRANATDLDWQRLVAEAERRRLTVAAGAALDYLAQEFDAPVPGEVGRALEAAPSSRHERAAFRAACRPDSPTRTLRMAWDRYRRLRDLDTGAPAPGSFLGFAQQFWGLDSPWRLPGHAASAFFRRARGADRYAA